MHYILVIDIPINWLKLMEGKRKKEQRSLTSKLCKIDPTQNILLFQQQVQPLQVTKFCKIGLMKISRSFRFPAQKEVHPSTSWGYQSYEAIVKLAPNKAYLLVVISIGWYDNGHKQNQTCLLLVTFFHVGCLSLSWKPLCVAQKWWRINYAFKFDSSNKVLMKFVFDTLH